MERGEWSPTLALLTRTVASAGTVVTSIRPALLALEYQYTPPPAAARTTRAANLSSPLPPFLARDRASSSEKLPAPNGAEAGCGKTWRSDVIRGDVILIRGCAGGAGCITGGGKGAGGGGSWTGGKFKPERRS